LSTLRLARIVVRDWFPARFVDDLDTDAVLLHAALAGVDGAVIVDVPLVNCVANDLVTAAGLAVERGYTRMGLPAGLVVEDNAVVHATAGADRG
jgi:hypothetical protein